MCYTITRIRTDQIHKIDVKTADHHQHTLKQKFDRQQMICLRPKGAKDHDSGSSAVTDLDVSGEFLKNTKEAIEPSCMRGK
jgi:hypothetical protein